MAENPWRNFVDDNPAQSITQLYLDVESWRQDYEDRWNDFYVLYRSYIDEDSHPFRANLFIPYTFTIIESIVPKMLGSVFNTKPIVSIITRKGNELSKEEEAMQRQVAEQLDISPMVLPTTDLAALIERILDYQFEEESLEFFHQLEQFFKSCAIYGTSFARISPEFRDDEFASLDYIDFKPLDLSNVYPDWRATSMKDMKFIIEKEDMDYDDLLDLQEQGIYKNVEKLKDRQEASFAVDEAKIERLADIGYDSGAPTRQQERRTVEVFKYWDRDKIYVIGGRKVVLMKDDNPFGKILPYVMMKYTSVPHELYGIGIPEMTECLQNELNAIRNQRMDNVNLIINRMFLVNKLADVDIDNLISYPGNIIATNDMEAVKPLVTADVSRSIYMEESTIKEDIENATGEWRYARGGIPERRETATGIIRLQQATNVRFDAVLKNIEFTFRDIAKLFIWYDSQFLEPTDFAKIVGMRDFLRMGGEYFYQLETVELLKLYHFQPVGSSTTAVKELRVQQVMQAFQLFNMDPYINQFQLRKLMLNTLDLKDHERYLRTEEEVQEMQRQQAMAQAEAEATAKGLAPPKPPAPGQGAPAGPAQAAMAAGGAAPALPGRGATKMAGTEQQIMR